MFDDASRFRVIHISNHKGIARRARQEGFVCIGRTKMGDASPLDSRAVLKEPMRKTWSPPPRGHPSALATGRSPTAHWRRWFRAATRKARANRPSRYRLQSVNSTAAAPSTVMTISPKVEW